MKCPKCKSDNVEILTTITYVVAIEDEVEVNQMYCRDCQYEYDY